MKEVSYLHPMGGGGGVKRKRKKDVNKQISQLEEIINLSIHFKINKSNKLYQLKGDNF